MLATGDSDILAWDREVELVSIDCIFYAPITTH